MGLINLTVGEDGTVLAGSSALASIKLPATTTIGGSSVAALTTITSVSANALTAGRQGTTDPVFNVDASTALVATGINIKGAAAASGVAVKVLSSGTDESLTLDAKGAGTILLNGTATGAVLVGDATNPAFSVVHTTEGTGLKVTSAAAASGVAVAAISSGTDENLTINAKGAGTLTINGVATGKVILGTLMNWKAIATPVAATGAGGGVAGAAALGAANVVYVSSDGATKGVKFPTSTLGDWKDIINTSSTACNLFAASGGTINGGAGDAGCTIPASKGVRAYCSAADTWIVNDMPARAGAAA